MRWVFVLVAMTVPAYAQTASERIEPRLRKAIEEHHVFLTCSSLDPQMHPIIASGWRNMVAKARAYLVARSASLADLATFDQRTAEDRIVATDAPLREAVELCTRTAPDWPSRYQLLDFTFDITSAASPP